MNDLPQNELFSAYLDGELTAAEQAEMEQLLATNPAARQLLNELRALSTTLQSLPRERLGEDLSRQVLRVAERRMLTEGGLGEDETAPLPLGKSIFQRFATRRNLIWLALTASIAVMIVFNEQRQGSKPVQVATHVAENAPMARRPREPGPPPTIQAAHDIAADTLESSGGKAEARLDRDVPTYDYGTERSIAKSDLRSAEAPGESLHEEPAAAAAPLQPATAVPRKNEPVRNVGKAAQKGGGIPRKAGQADIDAEQYEGLDEVDESVLVVHCDISPKAAANQALNRLLDANGIAEDQQGGQVVVDGKATQNWAKDTKQQATRSELPAPSEAADNESYVYVEATPAQISATLAGLTAQPDVFLAVSVGPAQDVESREMVRQYVGRDQVALMNLGKLRGGQAQSKTAIGSPVQADKPAAMPKDAVATPAPAAAAAPEAMPESDSGASEVESKNELGIAATQQPQSLSVGKTAGRVRASVQSQPQLSKQLQSQQLAQSALRQRVLFVVRVVDGEPLLGGAKAQDGVKADVATPAKEANDPAPTGAVPPADSPMRDR